VDLNNQIELKSAVASRKKSKIFHGPPHSLSSTLFSLSRVPKATATFCRLSIEIAFLSSLKGEKGMSYQHLLFFLVYRSSSESKQSQTSVPELSSQPPFIMKKQGPVFRHWLRGTWRDEEEEGKRKGDGEKLCRDNGQCFLIQHTVISLKG
jgi:hypothetical protein